MYTNLQEEELKIRIAEQFFAAFDCGTRIGKIDFCVTQPLARRNVTETAPIVSLLWAEAKRGTVSDIYKPLVQLILTIGKARTFDTYLPPPFLAAFDAEKIAFLPYREILPFLALNDFNWNVTPSDTSSREFGLLYAAVRDVLDRTAYLFRYDAHEKELREFIKQELKVSSKPLPLIKNHRERKGSFFTPKIWVDLSQKYLADVLGENWQDEYYVWDCAAGTGNLLNGLTNKYNIWASTLDQQDVDVMKDRIKNGANLLESHVFQFDFLNDEFTKLPQPLQDIINDPEKRKKLVIYINPPYKEAPKFGTNGQKAVEQSNTNMRYANILKQGTRELFAQFYTRIYYELSNVIIASFSTMKILQGAHFVDFRRFFRAKLEKIFLVPAATFDNVKGQFPIGFMIWRSGIQDKPFSQIIADVYNSDGDNIGNKSIRAYDTTHYMNEWIKPYRAKSGATGIIGKFPFMGNDFQHNNMVQINPKDMLYNAAAGQFYITASNLIQTAVYFAVRKCIPQTWLNNQDQFVCPTAGWQKDNEFQNNTLTFTLFSNNIQSQYGTNHWIPFTEQEVNAKEKFASHFMTDFIAGKLAKHQLLDQNTTSLRELGAEKSFVPTEPLVFSAEATAVFDAGRELWRYYHTQPGANPNASYYDIREHFQGRNEKGRMNAKSNDAEYNRLLGNLKEAMEALRLKIVPKVYEYGFLIF